MTESKLLYESLLHINPAKTNLVPFTRKLKFDHLRVIRLPGMDLERVVTESCLNRRKKKKEWNNPGSYWKIRTQALERFCRQEEPPKHSRNTHTAAKILPVEARDI